MDEVAVGGGGRNRDSTGAVPADRDEAQSKLPFSGICRSASARRRRQQQLPVGSDGEAENAKRKRVRAQGSPPIGAGPLRRRRRRRGETGADPSGTRATFGRICQAPGDRLQRGRDPEATSEAPAVAPTRQNSAERCEDVRRVVELDGLSIFGGGARGAVGRGRQGNRRGRVLQDQQHQQQPHRAAARPTRLPAPLLLIASQAVRRAGVVAGRRFEHTFPLETLAVVRVSEQDRRPGEEDGKRMQSSPRRPAERSEARASGQGSLGRRSISQHLRTSSAAGVGQHCPAITELLKTLKRRRDR